VSRVAYRLVILTPECRNLSIEFEAATGCFGDSLFAPRILYFERQEIRFVFFRLASRTFSANLLLEIEVFVNADSTYGQSDYYTHDCAIDFHCLILFYSIHVGGHLRCMVGDRGQRTLIRGANPLSKRAIADERPSG